MRKKRGASTLKRSQKAAKTPVDPSSLWHSIRAKPVTRPWRDCHLVVCMRVQGARGDPSLYLCTSPWRSRRPARSPAPRPAAGPRRSPALTWLHWHWVPTAVKLSFQLSTRTARAHTHTHLGFFLVCADKKLFWLTLPLSLCPHLLSGLPTIAPIKPWISFWSTTNTTRLRNTHTCTHTHTHIHTRTRPSLLKAQKQPHTLKRLITPDGPNKKITTPPQIDRNTCVNEQTTQVGHRGFRLYTHTHTCTDTKRVLGCLEL